MKKLKIISILLVMVLLFGGCGEPAATQNTTAPTTQPTEPATEPTEPDPIDNEEALRAALEAGGRVNLEGDIQLTQTLGVKGNIFNGGGHTITGMEYVEGDASTENALSISSGTVENLNIQGAYRCLGDSKDFPATGDVRIKNVTADGTTLALGLSKGSGQGTLYVDGCTLRGWVLHNKFKEAIFTNCTFSWNSLGTGGDLRPYVYTELINCRFEGKTDENGKYTPYRINFYKNSKGVILVLENCYVGDTLITEQNINSLLTVKAKNNTIIVRNSST